MNRTANIPQPYDVQPALEDAVLFSVAHAIRGARISSPSPDFGAPSNSVQEPVDISDHLSCAEHQNVLHNSVILPSCTSAPSFIRTVVKRKRSQPLEASTSRCTARSMHSWNAREATQFQAKARKSATTRSQAARLRKLMQEHLIRQVRPDRVFCLGCADWIALDGRGQYHTGLWYKHKRRYHTIVSDLRSE